MRKLFLLIFACGVALAIHAQEMPYSKYLNFSKEQFKENKFKYHKKISTFPYLIIESTDCYSSEAD